MGSVPFMWTVMCRTISWAALPSIGMFFLQFMVHNMYWKFSLAVEVSEVF